MQIKQVSTGIRNKYLPTVKKQKKKNKHADERKNMQTKKKRTGIRTKKYK